MKYLLIKTIDVAWRVLMIGLGYTLALIVAGMILGMLGLLQADMNADAAPAFLWMFVGALVMGLMLGIVARQTPASAARHVLILS